MDKKLAVDRPWKSDFDNHNKKGKVGEEGTLGIGRVDDDENLPVDRHGGVRVRLVGLGYIGSTIVITRSGYSPACKSSVISGRWLLFKWNSLLIAYYIKRACRIFSFSLAPRLVSCLRSIHCNLRQENAICKKEKSHQL